MLKINDSKMPFAEQAKARRTPQSEKLKQMKEKLRGAAQQYERKFLDDMVKAMKRTVPKNGLIKKSQAENIFQEQLDQKYVEGWTKRGGIGLSDLIYKQIMQNFGARMGLRQGQMRPQGPIPMNKSQHIEMKPHDGLQSKSFSLKNLQKTDANQVSQVPPIEVLSPWEGVLVDARKISEKNELVTLEHDNGLKSKLLLPRLTDLQIGDKVAAGQKIGLLPQGWEMVWQVEESAVNKGATSNESVAKNVSL